MNRHHLYQAIGTTKTSAEKGLKVTMLKYKSNLMFNILHTVT